MVFGMISANIAFRDGHKYQGPFGLINSWYLGLVFLYATVNYGLWTAVCVHALYNTEIALIRYVMRKLRS